MPTPETINAFANLVWAIAALVLASKGISVFAEKNEIQKEANALKREELARK